VSVAEIARAKLRLKDDAALAKATGSAVVKELGQEGFAIDRSWANIALDQVKTERGISTNGKH